MSEESLMQQPADDVVSENLETAAEDTAPIETSDPDEGQQDATTGEETSEEDKVFFGKYKSYDEAEKAFKHLNQKLREKIPEAPEEYQFDFEGDEDFADLGDAVGDLNPSEDPRFIGMKDIFKKHNLSQEAVTDIVKAQIQMDLNSGPDLEAEANALGEERDVILANAQLFVNKHLNAEEQAIAFELGKSAAGVKLLDKMSKMVGEKNIPAKVEAQDAGLSSKELFAQAFAYKSENPRFEFDTMAQKRYDRMLEAAVKAEHKEKTSR